jgi:flagellar basal body P-ring formation protein FlgA
MSMSLVVSIAAVMLASDVSAVVATDVIRAGEIITEANSAAGSELAVSDQDAMLGLSVRRTVYAGQPIRMDNTQTPRIVTRNQSVSVRYIDGPLEINITGRAMGEGGAGDRISVLNLQSKQTIDGTITEDGWILAQ